MVEPVKWIPANAWCSQQRAAHLDRVARQEVDHARRQARLLQQLVEVPVAERGGVRRLPHHRVAHERGRGRQVAADRREVERRDGVDEALERPVVHPVPHARRGVGLLPVDPLGVVDVEAEEVDQLAGAVDLGLVGGLALAQHGGRVEPLAVGRGQQVGRLEEDRRAILEAPVGPVALRLDGRGHGGVDRRAVGLVQPGQHPLVAVRARRRPGWPRSGSRARPPPPGMSGCSPPTAVSALLSAARSAVPGA